MLISHWTNQHAEASAMPSSATVNCAWLWNKQHLFLLISSLSVSKFVPVSLSLNFFSSCLWQTSLFSLYFCIHSLVPLKMGKKKKNSFFLFSIIYYFSLFSFVCLFNLFIYLGWGCLNVLSFISASQFTTSFSFR